MCPAREFTRQARLIDHLENYHVGKPIGIISKKLQQNVAAQWNRMMVKRSVNEMFGKRFEADSSHLVNQSASFMRSELMQSASWQRKSKSLVRKGHNFDREICVLLDMQNTRHILKCDSKLFHQISGKFLCTDAFLNAFLAALIHPATKGAAKRVMAFLVERSGRYAHLIPYQRDFFHTLCEHVLAHPALLAAADRCRAQCDVRVLGIDGCYKSLMSVLYQVPHGQKRQIDAGNSQDGLHVLLTVQCSESILNIHGAPSESAPHQVEALRGSVRKQDLNKVLMICSDYPVVLDGHVQLRKVFKKILCVCKDLLHIAIKVEKATNEHPTKFSHAIRRCLAKLRLGAFGRSRYYRKGVSSDGPSALPGLLRSMTPSESKRLYTRLQTDTYIDRPYTDISHFVEDLAAICLQYPDMMSKKTEGRSTVQSSLENATTVQELGYVKNFCKFVANNPSLEVMFGTTRNEAFHKQLKTFYRNVMHQLRRHALCVAAVATFAKLFAGFLQRHQEFQTSSNREHTLLEQLAAFLLAESPIKFEPRMRFNVIADPVIDQSSLPKNAKRKRKCPFDTTRGE